MQTSFLARLKCSIVTACALVLPLFYLLPLRIFAANGAEFSSGFFDLYPLKFVALIPAGIIILATGVSSTRGRYFERLTALLLALAVVVYSQSNFLTWKYGDFNGEEIAWGEYGYRSFIDWGVAIAILTIFQIFYRLVARRSTTIAILILMLAAGTSISEAISNKAIWWRSNSPESHDSLFQFSSRKNIVLILLDEFESQAFARMLETDPALATTYKDFTYYRNTTSSFPTTSPSIPSILSGVPIGAEGMKKYLTEIAPKSLPAMLRANGFQSDIVTYHPICKFLDIDSCQDQKGVGEQSASAIAERELLQLLDLAIFRSAPHDLKKLIFNDHRWFLQARGRPKGSPLQTDSLAFADLFLEKAKVSVEAPAFKFLHFVLPHAPYTFTKGCEFTEEHRGRMASYLANAYCSLNIADRILGKMKSLGIYEDSLIVILADHGSEVEMKLSTRKRGFGSALIRAFPLLLIKGAHQNRPSMEISSSPAALTDIPATVAAISKLDLRFPGLVISDSIPASRIRNYAHYKWQHDDWEKDTLPPRDEYQISGDAWDFGNWERVTK